MKKEIGRILVPGGVLSPGELRKIAGTVQYFNSDTISFGQRQEILFEIGQQWVEDVQKRLSNIQYSFTAEKAFQNIVTSFVSRNIFHSTPWLSEGVYLEILSSFTRESTLKINITDPQQSFVSLFSGQLNFIASPYDNYWYLFLNLDESSKMYQWPVLVDGNEIGPLSETIEELVKGRSLKISPVKIETYVYNSRTWNFRILDSPLKSSGFRFHNYEGFHPMGQKFWLGIYLRDGLFPVNFIENLCILCLQTNIGNITITPWNSLLIKNIEEKDIPLWENLLGQYGINTGHSHLELNWMLPDRSKAAQKLKNYIFKKFEKRGLRTEGLTFGLAGHKDLKLPATSIIIRERNSLGLPDYIPLFRSYSVSFRQSYNPNAQEIISFAEGLKRRNLPEILSYLCTTYYKSLGNFLSPLIPVQEEVKQEETHKVYQCTHCLTVYDPSIGDEFQNIIPGTTFEELPENFCCTLCEAGKSEFKPTILEKAIA